MSENSFLKSLDNAVQQKKLPQHLEQKVREYYFSYMRALQEGKEDLAKGESLLKQHLSYLLEQCSSPYQFPPYHSALRSPIDYRQFGLNFLEPLIDRSKSVVLNVPQVDLIESYIAKGENVILFANHQIEPDPQAIILMLQESHPQLTDSMIFVAGHRVTTDPFSIPFSLGCNLLCIYSKRYIETPPELKEEKLLHNQRTLSEMRELLKGGGKCIYVAPSGGRDRPDPQGNLLPSPFDSRSIEMFRLVAKQAKTPTHFFPLALFTYPLMPPPAQLETGLTESRTSKRSPIGLHFGEEILFDQLVDSKAHDKHECRELRAQAVWEQVYRGYQQIHV